MTGMQANVGHMLADRLNGWVHAFRHYRAPPDATTISEWLDRFDGADRDVATKVLDRVKVVGERDILIGYKAALESLPGWHPHPGRRLGRWFFVGFGKPGESGPAMLRLFREANNLAYARYDPLFVSIAELPELGLTAEDHVVFVDDFSGSGRQVVRMWPRIEELVASEAKSFLVLTALTEAARQEITENTELTIVASYEIGADLAVYHPENTDFSAEERQVLDRYGAVADPINPQGVGGLGVLFVLSHKAANNCLPVLHINAPHWRGILPRYLKP